MFTSKEVLEKTGISRATLNNYIGCGLVPKPDVLPPEPQDGAAPRIGYFPASVIHRIEEIQRLKSEGWSIARITDHFTGGPAPKPAPAAQAAPRSGAAIPPTLSLGGIRHPAYMVDSRFNVIWMSEAARSDPSATGLPPDALFQPVLKYVVGRSQEAVLRLHMGLALQRGTTLWDLCRGVAPEQVPLVEQLHRDAEAFQFPMVVRVPAAGMFLYAISFPEGILFVYAPGEADTLAPALFEHPETVSPPAQRRGAPALTDVAVLATGLQDGARLWAELPPEEYFELINEIWLAVDPIFRRHHGTPGKHPGEGMVCYFLPGSGAGHAWNAVAAAHEVREAMRRINKEWQLRKGWATELFMNTGVSEGQEWCGTLRPGAGAEFTGQGDVTLHAARLSDLARSGAVWVTRHLVVKLEVAERERLKWGVWRVRKDGREAFVPRVFSRAENLVADCATGGGFGDIARLPVTEIVSIAADPGSVPGGAAARPPE